MAIPHGIRYPVFFILLVFAIITLAINAHLLSLEQQSVIIYTPSPTGPLRSGFVARSPRRGGGGGGTIGGSDTGTHSSSQGDSSGTTSDSTSESSSVRTQSKRARETFEKLGLSVSILTLITIAAFLLLDRGKKHPTIAVEVGWLGTLWIMWTVTLGLVAAHSCVSDIVYYVDALSCPADRSVLAFTILIWVFMLLYLGTIATYASIAKKRGNEQIWESRVREADFRDATPSSDAEQQTQQQGGATEKQQPPFA